MDNILIVSDFPDVQYKKDSGTPAFRLIVEALSKKYNIHIIAPNGEAQSNGNIFYYRIPDTQFINGSSRLSNIINKKVFWFTFTRKAHEIAIILNKQYDFKLVYGAGCNSVYAASYIGRYFDMPSVGRLFGTYLYPYLHKHISLALRFEEVLAFKSSCTNFIITNDGTGGDEVARYFKIPSEKLYFWRNGVERPLDKVVYDDTIRIISMARLEGWKHVERIIEAFSEVATKNMFLDIVGGGPEEDNLKELVGYLDLDDKVIFHGEVPREKALSLLSNSDIFMSTNDYSNISNSLMEAMSGGKGIIVLNTGKTSDIIDGTNGLVVEEEELAAAITQMCNKEIRAFLGYKAKQYAASHFESWDSRIKKEVAVCDELIYKYSVYRLIPDELKRRIR
jgi:glycosyltransferase involved in cell wall biosynthesis